jgi:NADH pyrophosphatase NudC (nudix superfamily)
MKLDILPPKYYYCPFCGKQMASRNEEDKVRDYCIECKWTHYPYMALSAGAMISK